jgi:hypothetical protein
MAEVHNYFPKILFRISPDLDLVKFLKLRVQSQDSDPFALRSPSYPSRITTVGTWNWNSKKVRRAEG